MLTTFDKLFIFVLREEKCTVLSSVADKLVFGLSGAILVELTLQGKVRTIASRKLELIDPAPVGEGVLDEITEILHKSGQSRKVSYWLRHLAENPLIGRKRMFERLVSLGVLSQGEEGFSWVIPYSDSPHPNAPARYAIKNRLREAVLAGDEPGLDDLALLSVMKGSRLLDLVFTKGERKGARQRIYTALMNRVMNDPAAQTIHEIEVALEVICANP